MYIVVWCNDGGKQNGDLGKDHWAAFDSLKDARKRYKELDDTHEVSTVTLAGVLKSSDYIPYEDALIEGI